VLETIKSFKTNERKFVFLPVTSGPAAVAIGVRRDGSDRPLDSFIAPRKRLSSFAWACCRTNIRFSYKSYPEASIDAVRHWQLAASLADN